MHEFIMAIKICFVLMDIVCGITIIRYQSLRARDTQNKILHWFGIILEVVFAPIAICLYFNDMMNIIMLQIEEEGGDTDEN